MILGFVKKLFSAKDYTKEVVTVSQSFDADIQEPVIAIMNSIKNDKGRWKLYVNNTMNGLSIESHEAVYNSDEYHRVFYEVNRRLPMVECFLLDTKTGIRVNFVADYQWVKVPMKDDNLKRKGWIRRQQKVKSYSLRVNLEWATFDENRWLSEQIGCAIRKREEAIIKRLDREKVRAQKIKEMQIAENNKRERNRVKELFNVDTKT